MSKIKNGNNTSKINIKRIITGTLLVLLVVLLLVYGIFIAFFWQQNKQTDDSRLALLIIQAIDALHKPLPLDAQTGKAYISDARLTLPAIPMELGGLSYSYSVASGEFGDDLIISSNNNVNAAKSLLIGKTETAQAIFEAVPRLQACSRGVHVSSKMLDSGVIDAGSKTLSNGKVVYFGTESQCQNTDLLNYVKQIDSY